MKKVHLYCFQRKNIFLRITVSSGVIKNTLLIKGERLRSDNSWEEADLFEEFTAEEINAATNEFTMLWNKKQL